MCTLGYVVEDLEEARIPEKIKVVVCEPGKIARVAEIGTSLEDNTRFWTSRLVMGRM